MQHKGLIALINELHTAMLEGRANQVAGRILDDLVRYTENHFAYEESMLEKRGYPSLPDHHLQHQRLTAEVRDLRDKLRAGRLSVSLEVMKFLKDWLANHILSADQAYARVLARS
jgi:hemerythrin-like metal-binding protein